MREAKLNMISERVLRTRIKVVARRLHVTPATVCKWRGRFIRQRPDRLYDEPLRDALEYAGLGEGRRPETFRLSNDPLLIEKIRTG